MLKIRLATAYKRFSYIWRFRCEKDKFQFLLC